MSENVVRESAKLRGVSVNAGTEKPLRASKDAKDHSENVVRQSTSSVNAHVNITFDTPKSPAKSPLRSRSSFIKNQMLAKSPEVRPPNFQKRVEVSPRLVDDKDCQTECVKNYTLSPSFNNVNSSTVQKNIRKLEENFDAACSRSSFQAQTTPLRTSKEFPKSKPTPVIAPVVDSYLAPQLAEEDIISPRSNSLEKAQVQQGSHVFHRHKLCSAKGKKRQQLSFWRQNKGLLKSFIKTLFAMLVFGFTMYYLSWRLQTQEQARMFLREEPATQEAIIHKNRPK